MGPLSENAKLIYERLYLSKELGETSPTDVHKRVAKFVASAETSDSRQKELEEAFFYLMENNIFRPNSPVMMNGGVGEKKAILSACFVGHVEDDLLSILDLDREAAIIFSHGAGIGVNWGVLREKNAPLSSGGKASGPISFMRKLNATADCVKSGGRARRAAIWSGLFDWHPDIEEFINCKRTNSELQAMNLSIVASNAFMDAVQQDDNWSLRSVVDGSLVKEIKARELFRTMCESAHMSGDPGLVFIDRINQDNLTPSLGQIIATNPCGEEPLLPRGSCCLGSINVGAFVRPDGSFDNLELTKAIFLGVRFLDNVLDLSAYPTDQYRETSMLSRNIGLGFMGLADALFKLGLTYGSSQAILFVEELSKFFLEASIEASAQLASERGQAPAYKQNKDHILRFVRSKNLNTAYSIVEKFGVRNCSWTTIAPTGSISLSADCSQGMEPYFAITYAKRLSDTNQVLYITPPVILEHYPEIADYFPRIVENNGSCQNIHELPEEIREVAVCAHDIHWTERLSMQAAMQRYTSAAISSTVNLKNQATVEDIENIYMAAYLHGLKGITVYRDGSHAMQPVVFGGSSDKKVRRPALLSGKTHKIKTGHGNIYLTVNMDSSGQVLEIFTNGGKNGTGEAANLEALARVLSIALQEGASIERLTKTIIGISDGTSIWTKLDDADDKPVVITSIPDAVGKVLARFYANLPSVIAEPQGNTCPECGNAVYHSEGCVICYGCGWSKCS